MSAYRSAHCLNRWVGSTRCRVEYSIFLTVFDSRSAASGGMGWGWAPRLSGLPPVPVASGSRLGPVCLGSKLSEWIANGVIAQTVPYMEWIATGVKLSEWIASAHALN